MLLLIKIFESKVFEDTVKISIILYIK